MDKLKAFYSKYREQVLYLLFGAVVSIVCLGSHWIAARLIGLSTGVAYGISWALAMILAFITNKLFVFGSGKSSAGRSAIEGLTFLCCRVLTGLLGGAFTVLTVEKLLFPEMLMRLIGSVIEVVLNYFLSKMIVFRKKPGK